MAKVIEFGSAEAEELARRILEEYERERAKRVVGPFNIGSEIVGRLAKDVIIEFSPGQITFTLPADPDHDYIVEALVRVPAHKSAKAILDDLIRAGRPGDDWEYEEIKFFLYAVQHSIQENKIKIRYIYHIRSTGIDNVEGGK